MGANYLVLDDSNANTDLFVFDNQGYLLVHVI